ncbi:MAG: METTL5 family protein [Nanoarchaeota archaeon]|nr:METTL5 family protein [Nanoarchaeota archaeon]
MIKKVMSKKELEIILSQLLDFANPKVNLEQYLTDAGIAADALWNAYQNQHIKGKVIADLGCGPGIFGLGALILGAKKVHFVDMDKDVLNITKENKKIVEKIVGRKIYCVFHNINVKDFQEKVGVVLQNPPFGVKKTHHDKIFLVKAMDLSNIVYSFHKLSTKDFVDKVVNDNGFKVKHFYTYEFPIKKQFWFHMSKVKNIDVGCWCIVKS